MSIKLVPKRASGRANQPRVKAVPIIETQPISDKEVGDKIVTLLAQTTGPEGYVSASRVATKSGLSLSVAIRTLVKLANEKRILRYGPDEDLWAVSLKVREVYEKGGDLSQRDQIPVEKQLKDSTTCPVVEVRQNACGPVEIKDHPKKILQVDGEDIYCSNCGVRWPGLRKHFHLDKT